MAIITKGGTPAKGSPTTFTLNKADLLANSVVSSDTYFSTSTNWNTVVLLYTSSEGNQRSRVSFDADEVTPTSDFLVDLTARDIFEISQITIYDKQNGFLAIPRSELTTADFDVDMTPAGNYVVWDVLSPSAGDVTAANGGLDGTTPVAAFNNNSASTTSFAGDFSVKLTIDATGLTTLNGHAAGFGKTAASDVFIGDARVTGFYAGSAGSLDIYPRLDGTNQTVATMIAGVNILLIDRVSSTVTMTLNGSVIATGTDSRTIYPYGSTLGRAGIITGYEIL